MNQKKLLDAVAWLALELFYLMTFGLAAWLKWSQGMPDWFAKQFQATWLASGPFGLQGAFYFLACLETLACAGFLISTARLEWLRGKPAVLRASLTFSMLVFLLLAYGSRLTQKFDIAGWNYVYLIGTFITVHLLARREAPPALEAH